MKNSRPATVTGGRVSTIAVASDPANDPVPRKIFNKKGEVKGSFTEADVERDKREEQEQKAWLEREGLKDGSVAGIPEIAHPKDHEQYEQQMAIVTDWFLEMWERMDINDDKPGQPGHEARYELQTLLLNTIDQVLRVARSKKNSSTKVWAGELLAIIGVGVRKHHKKLKTNAAYAEMEKKLSGKGLTSVFYTKWIGQIVQRELKEAERCQKHLLLLKAAYGKKWKEAAKRESIPEAYYATVNLPELRKKKFQDNTKAQVYLEKTENRWWEFLWPLISKQINAQLPKVKRFFERSGTLYPSRHDHGARGHLHLIVCLRVKGVL